MVVGMALILSSPFILASQESVIQLRDATNFLDLDKSLDRVRGTAVELNSSSYPARRVVEFKTPQGVQNIYKQDLSPGSALIFEIDARGKPVNRSIIMDVKLDLYNKTTLGEEGIHRVSMKKKVNRGVNLSVIP